jgi:hypothetical protein
MLKNVIFSLVVILSICSCSNRPGLKIEFRDSPQEVEVIMQQTIPTFDSIFSSAPRKNNSELFRGFHIDDKGLVLVGSKICGPYSNWDFMDLPGFPHFSEKTRKDFIASFDFLYRNGIRGIYMDMEPEFEYAPPGTYDRDKYYCGIFLNNGAYDDPSIDEVDRKGKLILECRKLRRIIYEN